MVIMLSPPPPEDKIVWNDHIGFRYKNILGAIQTTIPSVNHSSIDESVDTMDYIIKILGTCLTCH